MNVRIYYEDTDAGGVVYHANYLKYFERARTEYLRERGFSVAELAAAGHVFPVIRMEVDLKAPARHDDLLTIATWPVSVSASSFSMQQQALRSSDGKVLVDARITLACVGPTHRAKRIPPEIRRLLEAELTSELS